jgi:hypothetical protein
MTTKPPLQKILQGILQTENESKQTMKGQEKLSQGEEKERKKRVTLIQLHTI